MRINFLFFFLVCFFQTSFASQYFQPVDSTDLGKPSIFRLMEQHEVTPVVITTAFDDFVEQRMSGESQDGLLSFRDTTNQLFEMHIELAPRGKTRLRTCDLPPIKITFDKKDLDEVDLKKYHKLKLVIPCFNDPMGKEYVFRELLAYELFGLVSKYALKTQPAKLTFIDSISQDTTHELIGFFLESDKEFRKRHEIKQIERYNIQWSELDLYQAQLMSLFQYLISNTDWRMNVNHNLCFFNTEKDSAFIMVPYDFDFCGLVNANYAKPNPDYRQQNVRQRIYLGESNDHLKEVMAVFNEKKLLIYQHIQDFTFLDQRAKKDILEFVDDFYKTLGKKRKWKSAFRKYEAE